MSKTPCICPACIVLIDLALTLRSLGAIEEAEMVARSITWIDESSEGYTQTWDRPVVPVVDSIEWN